MKNLPLSIRFENSLHKIYLLCGGLMCLLFIVLIPPFRIPDEQRHYLAASALVEGHIVCHDNRHQIAIRRLDLIEKMGLDKTMVVPPPGFDWNRVFQYSESSDMGFKNISTLVCGAPLYGHTVAALGIFIGEQLGFNTLVGLYFGRISCAIFGLIVVAYAIRIAPGFKKLFFILGMLPVTLTHFSTITYDSLVVPGLFLLFGVFLRVLYSKKIDIKLLLCCLPGIAALGLKPFYYPVFLALSIVLALRFKRYRKKIVMGNVVLVFVLLKLFADVLIFTPKGNVITSMEQYTFFQESNVHLIHNSNYTFNQLFQVQQIVFHPLFFGKALVGAFVLTAGVLPFELSGYVGLEARYYFGMAVLFITFMMGLGFLFEIENPIFFSRFEKAVFLFFGTLSAVLLYAYLFIGNSVIGLAYINGIQGKYFIPHLFLLGIVFLKQDKSMFKVSNNTFYYVVLIGLFILSNLMIGRYLFSWYVR